MANLSSQLLKAFSFIDSDNIIRRIDPRTKIVFMLSYLVLIIMLQQLMLQVIIFVSILPFITAGKLFKNIIKTMKNMVFLFIFIIILNTIFLSFNLGVQMAFRFFNIMIVFSIVFQTTDPDDLTQALTKMGISYNIAFSLSLAFRFIPTIAQELEIIMDAQKSRGYDFEKGGIIKQIKNLFPLLIPIVSNSIQRAYYVAESLESRSFGAKGYKRSYIYPIKMKKIDWFLCIWFVLLFIFGIYAQINIGQLPSWLLWAFNF